MSFIIGVTGHRIIDRSSIDGVKREVKQFFQATRKKRVDEKQVLLTSLAEGADRIAARIALEEGLPIQVILPMPLSEYMTDFYTKASQEEFMSLYDAAEKVIEMNSMHCDREHAYLQVGLYIAQASQILLALWDCRKDREKFGGTAHLLRCQFEDAADRRRTYVIPTRREPEDALLHIQSGFWNKETYQALK